MARNGCIEDTKSAVFPHKTSSFFSIVFFVYDLGLLTLLLCFDSSIHLIDFIRLGGGHQT